MSQAPMHITVTQDAEGRVSVDHNDAPAFELAMLLNDAAQYLLDFSPDSDEGPDDEEPDAEELSWA